MSPSATAAPASVFARSMGREERGAQFNIEYRVADAAASPYLALGALIWAGVDGIRQGAVVAAGAGAQLLGYQRSRTRGRRGARKLPQSLKEALAETGGQRGGARVVRRDVLSRLCDVQASRIARGGRSARGRDLCPLCGCLLKPCRVEQLTSLDGAEQGEMDWGRGMGFALLSPSQTDAATSG